MLYYNIITYWRLYVEDNAGDEKALFHAFYQLL